MIRRRSFTQMAFSAAALTGLYPFAQANTSVRASIVVIGGGFAGVTTARMLKALNPNLQITLVERNRTYTACPFSNLVITHTRPLKLQQFTYGHVSDSGIEVVHASAQTVDPEMHRVQLANGLTLAYDKLVMSPGIELDFAAVSGYSPQGAEQMPHAWLAGKQTTILAQRLRQVPTGGLVLMSIPENPYRCPPGPYERASLIAHYLKQHNPRAKLLLLDAKDTFSKQALFNQAWQKHYGALIEWRGGSNDGRIRAVSPDQNLVETDFDRFKPDLANIIPPQRAASIARDAGLTNASHWCPIDATTFASTLQPDIYVLGDACIANAMPKSAFAANAQGKICALQIARNLAGQTPVSAKLINTCYSLTTPEHAISVAGVYRPDGNRFAEIPEAGGTSVIQAAPGTRQLEAHYARDWFTTITREVFG